VLNETIGVIDFCVTKN